MPIQRLSDECLNRIAAGEVLVRPLNAVKELLENSIDAKSTSISVIIGNGGMQTIQVLDNGTGIPVNDHPLVCERFATSKLEQFEDLTNGSLSSFGFRGEALASMSLVGHVSIFSKTKTDSTTSESRYLHGSILPNYPVPSGLTLGDSGTRVVVDDLFYEHPVKKRAYKKSEYRKILELLMQFMVCYPEIDFRLKSFGELSWDVESPTGDRVDRIASIYKIPKNILRKLQMDSVECIFAPNSCSLLVMLVNDRLVELPVWRDRLLPLVNGFVFVSLSIEKNQIDVNVNPTKRQVVFQNESGFLNSIMEAIASMMVTNTVVTSVKRIKPNHNSIATQPFRIHTCPSQIFFKPENSILTLSQQPTSRSIATRVGSLAPSTATEEESQSQGTWASPEPESGQSLTDLGSSSQFTTAEPGYRSAMESDKAVSKEPEPSLAMFAEIDSMAQSEPSQLSIAERNSVSQSELSQLSISEHKSVSQSEPSQLSIAERKTVSQSEPSQLSISEHKSVSQSEPSQLSIAEHKTVATNNEPKSVASDKVSLLMSLLQKYEAIDLSPISSLVFVGAVNGEFAICQYSQFLCLCNIQYLSKFLLKTYFLKRILHQNESISDLENWSESQLHVIKSLWDDCCDETNLDAFLAQLSSFFLEQKNLQEIFNEVIKNKSIAERPSRGSSISVDPLGINDSKDFFFREIISLKELYREFERC